MPSNREVRVKISRICLGEFAVDHTPVRSDESRRGDFNGKVFPVIAVTLEVLDNEFSGQVALQLLGQLKDDAITGGLFLVAVEDGVDPAVVLACGAALGGLVVSGYAVPGIPGAVAFHDEGGSWQVLYVNRLFDARIGKIFADMGSRESVAP